MIHLKNIAALIAALLISATIFGQNPVDNTAPAGNGNVVVNDGGIMFSESALWWDKNNDRLGIARAGSANNTLDVGGSIRAIGTGIYTAVGAPVLRLENSTASTGRPYYFLSSNTGDLELYSTPNVTPIFTIGNLGDAATAKRLVLGQLWGASSSGNMLLGRNSAGGLCRITLGAGLTLTDSTLTASGGGSSYYQTVRDNGTARTQRGKLNLLSTAQIVLSATDDSGNDETEVAAALAQNGATTGQVMAWNGTTWAPAAAGAASFNIISPAQLSAQTDNWNPTDLATANHIRLSGDNGFRMITGITAPAAAKTLILSNVGDFAVLLTREHTASSAANRFSLENDLPLLPGESLTLVYDATSSRWRVSAMPPLANSNNFFSIQQGRFASTTAADYDYLNFAANSGSISGANASAGSLCRLSCSTSSSASSFPTITLKGVSAFADNTVGNNTAMTFTTKVHYSAVSDGSQTYTTRAGILASASSGDDAGCYFRYTHTENSGNWVCVTRSVGGSETVTNTSVAPIFALSSGQKLQVYIRPDGTSAFFIDGVNVAEHAATNFPDNTNMTIRVQTQKTLGTTNVFMHVSWVGFDNCLR